MHMPKSGVLSFRKLRLSSLSSMMKNLTCEAQNASRYPAFTKTENENECLRTHKTSLSSADHPSKTPTFVAYTQEAHAILSISTYTSLRLNKIIRFMKESLQFLQGRRKKIFLVQLGCFLGPNFTLNRLVMSKRAYFASFQSNSIFLVSRATKLTI